MLSKSQLSFNTMPDGSYGFSRTPPPSSFYGQSANMQSTFVFDPRNLEIKTKSVEQTLLPLVTQISTLVNFKESIVTGNKPRSERALRAALKIGSAVEIAVERRVLWLFSVVEGFFGFRFVVVGESIADENPDIQPEMYDACHEARHAGAAIANLHSSLLDEIGNPQIGIDKSQLVRAARQLLSSVTRVLLLADRVLVTHILRAEDKIAYSLTKLENTSNFTEFVRIFTEFGAEMVVLAHRSGDRQQDLKSEKRKAQLSVARASLERMTMLLLTSSKTLLRHPDDDAARQCRDGVFYQIRFALQLVALCITDGVLPLEPNRYCPPLPPNFGPLDIGLQTTANVKIRQLVEMLEMVRMTSNVAGGVRERLIGALDSLCEMTHDFTESAYTLDHQKEQILDFLEECRFEMSNLVQQPTGDGLMNDQIRVEGIEVGVERLNRRLKDLQKQLQQVAMDQIGAVFRMNDDHTILGSLKTCSVSGDIDGVEKYLEKFREHAIHIQQVCRLLYHISITDSLHVRTGHAERSLRSLAPLISFAGRTLCIHPSSRIARENLEVFCDTWAAHINDLSRLSRDCDAAAAGRVAAERQAYMSLPRPGKHGVTQKPTKPMTLDVEDQAKIAKVGLEMKLLTAEVEAEAEKWDMYSENDIVKRAKLMSTMSYNMYLFTKGDGPLKTTHDLFTQAEFFAEQANKMYKTVRDFAFEVPGSAEKNDLQIILERIPNHYQQLQVLVKTPTVGKAATFSKVDEVISGTKTLMNEIAKVVTACFVCATKFEIEFRGTSTSRGAFADGGADYTQRNSRESTTQWRRTPSQHRRTVPPQLHLSSIDAQ
ncbi:Alpha-catulin [Aphelenchoides besseyi]|nr:Alpha-catulin [Aphelenchoides besseyi]